MGPVPFRRAAALLVVPFRTVTVVTSPTTLIIKNAPTLRWPRIARPWQSQSVDPGGGAGLPVATSYSSIALKDQCACLTLGSASCRRGLRTKTW